MNCEKIVCSPNTTLLHLHLGSYLHIMIKRTQIEVHVFTLNTFLLLAEALTGQLMLVYDKRKKNE